MQEEADHKHTQGSVRLYRIGSGTGDNGGSTSDNDTSSSADHSTTTTTGSGNTNVTKNVNRTIPKTTMFNLQLSPLILSLIGVYSVQAVAANVIFVALALASQKLQETLDIDTGSIMLGQLAGIVTVMAGGYAACILSEMIVNILFSAKIINNKQDLWNTWTQRSNRSVALPISAVAAIGSAAGKWNALHRVTKAISPLMTTTIGIPADLTLELKKHSIKGNEHIPVIGSRHSLLTGNKKTKEAAVIALYCLSTFVLLGGRLHSFTPSNIAYPGAFAVPSSSLLADGYNYATKKQKQNIQQVGKQYGCHTCGRYCTNGKYIADHQPPSGLIKKRIKSTRLKFLIDHGIIPLSIVKPKQYFYPQCTKCSQEQASAIHANSMLTNAGISVVDTERVAAEVHGLDVVCTVSNETTFVSGDVVALQQNLKTLCLRADAGSEVPATAGTLFHDVVDSLGEPRLVGDNIRRTDHDKSDVLLQNLWDSNNSWVVTVVNVLQCTAHQAIVLVKHVHVVHVAKDN
ncbi:hypothetical protein BaOVIS_030340 [Babesia ovis]|uniref:Uncharacterized protein n=1 Tax=Babesia ovis TaxID=5869 RepID=A0A9W5TCX6_BABOV|nr:hypothetical protein BaOVIS_030340 [Babesia ovis]